MIEKVCPFHGTPTLEGVCKCKEYNELLGYKEACLAIPKQSVTIYWCNKHNIPLFNDKCDCCINDGDGTGADVKYIGTDIRPVFPEEQVLLAILDGKDDEYYLDKSVWHNGACYIVNGEKVKLSIELINNYSLDVIKGIKERLEKYIITAEDEAEEAFESLLDYSNFNTIMELFVKANQDRFHFIEDEATDMIRKWAEGFDATSMFVSFSGGKDSTVVSSLVRNALSTNAVRHVYGDTTLEFVTTEKYKERMKRKVVKAGYFTTAKNRIKNFEELCKVYGPPSRVMRWCCTVFKTGAITDTMNKAFANKTNVLSFQGIRKSESASRSKYDRESNSSKIAKQKTVLPIFEWTDFDVWLYIMTTGIDFNQAYRLGFSRVGCWCCPNNGNWSEILSKIYMHDRYAHWRNILIEYAKQVGKEDAEQYVDDGKWKARQGGNGLEAANASILSYEPCAVENDTYNYELQRPIDDQLYELFKPFGKLDFSLGNKITGEVYVLDKLGNPIMVLKGRKGTNNFKVTIKDKKRVTEGKINCQITKYQMCCACRACESVCKMNAVRVSEDAEGEITYKIDENKCVNCGECINHFNAGCYMRKILTIKRG